MITCPYCGHHDLRYPAEDADRVHWTDEDAGIIRTPGVECRRCGKRFDIILGFLADTDEPEFRDEHGAEIEAREED